MLNIMIFYAAFLFLLFSGIAYSNEVADLLPESPDVAGYNYYKTNADVYQNPHEEIITSLISQSLDRIDYGESIYDLCCGNGLVTKLLNQNIRFIKGIDPYMASQYREQTGKDCFELDFKQMSQNINLPKVNTIVCSFALHLCPESLLPNVLYNLSQLAQQLVIITPNKKPNITQFWEMTDEIVQDRVRLRIYKRK